MDNTDKDKRGGKRPGSGRKSTGVKTQVCLYINTEAVEAVGGYESVKSICYNAIQDKAPNLVIK